MKRWTNHAITLILLSALIVAGISVYYTRQEWREIYEGDEAPIAGDCGLGDLRGRQKREAAQMKKLTIPALAFIVVQHTAFAFPVTEAGPSLGLGRGDSPTFAGSARFRQAVIARLFGSSTSFGFTPNTKISVDADSVVCRVSNVDITSRGCDLSFGSRKRTLTGREANELGATTAVAGVPSQEAAGSST